MSSSDVTTFIYTLSDPRDGKVYYVGKTVNLERRYREHISTIKHGLHINARELWLCDVASTGHKPILHVVDQTSGDAVYLEQRWIAYYHGLGSPLTNQEAPYLPKAKARCPLAGVQLSLWGNGGKRVL